MSPVQHIQNALDAEVKNLLQKHHVVVRGTVTSTTAVLIGNFIVSKSTLSPFLKRLGYSRNKRVTGVGRLYFKVNNFAEIILAIYYLYLLAPHIFIRLAKDPFAVIEGMVKDKISIPYPMTCYLEFRNKLYHKRCMSMGTSNANAAYATRDYLWINKLKASTAAQVIQSGEEMKINPAVICIALLEREMQDTRDFKEFIDSNLSRIQKAFITFHYIRAMLTRVSNYNTVRDVLGFSHADVNAMATEYQDNIARLLDNMKNGEFITI